MAVTMPGRGGFRLLSRGPDGGLRRVSSGALQVPVEAPR